MLSVRILRAYFWNRVHSTPVGILLKDWPIERFSNEAMNRHMGTHEVCAFLIPNIRRKGFQQWEKLILCLPQHIQRWFFKIFATACQGNDGSLSSRRNEFVGEKPRNFIHVEAGVHRRYLEALNTCLHCARKTKNSLLPSMIRFATVATVLE